MERDDTDQRDPGPVGEPGQRRVVPARRFDAPTPARSAGIPPPVPVTAKRPPPEPVRREPPSAGPVTPATSPPVTAPPPYPGLAYQGPPPMQAPPAGWRPDSVVVPSTPHNLPVQDHDAIDRAEAQAAALTRAIAIGAGVILLVLVLALCSRALF